MANFGKTSISQDTGLCARVQGHDLGQYAICGLRVCRTQENKDRTKQTTTMRFCSPN